MYNFLNIFDKKRVFLLYGMRRSGNHACINWLINSLEFKDCHRIGNYKNSKFTYTESKKTFLINEINKIKPKAVFQNAVTHSSILTNCENIIISVEDSAPHGTQWKIPSSWTCIKIVRSTPNLLASRYQSLNRYALNGLSNDNMSMNKKFVKEMRRIYHSTDYAFGFESWLTDESWRKKFLRNLNLTADIMPKVSEEGGGSSFSGQEKLPEPSELKTRFRQVSPKEKWITFLSDFRKENPDLFSREEKLLVDEFCDNY